MQPYNEEWWHYNSPLTQMGARADGRKSAKIGACVLSDKNLEHEHARRAEYQKMIDDFINGSSKLDPRNTNVETAAYMIPVL